MRPPDRAIPVSILRLVSRRPVGLTIEEISQELKINRATASKYLLFLEGQDKVIARELGKAKLHYPKTKEVESWLR